MKLDGKRCAGRLSAQREAMRLAYNKRFPFGSSHPKQNLAELHRLRVFGHDFRDNSAGFGFDFIHHFHRFDDANHGVFADSRAHIDK